MYVVTSVGPANTTKIWKKLQLSMEEGDEEVKGKIEFNVTPNCEQKVCDHCPAAPRCGRMKLCLKLMTPMRLFLEDDDI